MQSSTDVGIFMNAGPPRAPAPTGVVLVAAHDADVETALRQAHHEIAKVASCAELERTLADPVLREAIDVVVVDIALPGHGALDIVARRKTSGGPPFVVLSPFTSRALYDEARRAGAFVVLREPVLAEHLCAVVATLMRKSAATS